MIEHRPNALRCPSSAKRASTTGTSVIVECDCWVWLLSVMFSSYGVPLIPPVSPKAVGLSRIVLFYFLVVICHCFCILSNVLFVYCRERSEQLIGKGCVVLDCRIIRCWIIEIGGLVKMSKLGDVGGCCFHFSWVDLLRKQGFKMLQSGASLAVLLAI